MKMSIAVDEYAKTVEDKKTLAVEAFRKFPIIIADKSGYDNSEIV